MPLSIFKSKLRTSATTGETTTTTILGADGESAEQKQFANFKRLQVDSPLLRECERSTASAAAAAPLEREEVHTSNGDKGLPVGTFYHAYSVTRICLKEKHDESLDARIVDNSDASFQEDSHQSARKTLAKVSSEQEKGYYSIKYLNKKTIKRLQAADQQLLIQSMTNLLVEANYLSKFQHPHILVLRGQGGGCSTSSPSDGCFLITDRLSETLEERLERWQGEHAKNPKLHDVDPACPTFDTKLEYARDIASALQYIHERQIMVLGLNPSSIGFLAESGRLQLCDLGTCREVSAFHQHQDGIQPLQEQRQQNDPHEEIRFDDDEIGDGERFVSCGSDKEGAMVDHGLDSTLLIPSVETGTIPRYMAPEVVTQGAGSASLMADVYSWAMVFFEMITLQKALSSLRQGQYLVKVCVEGKRPNLSTYPKLPIRLEGLLRRCWRHSAEKRLTSAQIVEALGPLVDKLGGNDDSQQDNHESTSRPSARRSSVGESMIAQSTRLPPRGRRDSRGMDGSMMAQSMVATRTGMSTGGGRRSSGSMTESQLEQYMSERMGPENASLVSDRLAQEKSTRRQTETAPKQRRRHSNKGLSLKAMSMRNLVSTEEPVPQQKPPQRQKSSPMNNNNSELLAMAMSAGKGSRSKSPKASLSETRASKKKRSSSSKKAKARSPSRGRSEGTVDLAASSAGETDREGTGKKNNRLHRRCQSNALPVTEKLAAKIDTKRPSVNNIACEGLDLCLVGETTTSYDPTSDADKGTIQIDVKDRKVDARSSSDSATSATEATTATELSSSSQGNVQLCGTPVKEKPMKPSSRGTLKDSRSSDKEQKATDQEEGVKKSKSATAIANLAASVKAPGSAKKKKSKGRRRSVGAEGKDIDALALDAMKRKKDRQSKKNQGEEKKRGEEQEGDPSPSSSQVPALTATGTTKVPRRRTLEPDMDNSTSSTGKDRSKKTAPLVAGDLGSKRSIGGKDEAELPPLTSIRRVKKKAPTPSRPAMKKAASVRGVGGQRPMMKKAISVRGVGARPDKPSRENNKTWSSGGEKESVKSEEEDKESGTSASMRKTTSGSNLMSLLTPMYRKQAVMKLRKQVSTRDF